MSPDWSPAASAGESSRGATTTSTQVSLKLVQASRSSGFSRFLTRHLGADAAELAGQVAQGALVFLRRHVAAERVLDAVLEHALDARPRPACCRPAGRRTRAFSLVVGLAERREGLARRDAGAAGAAGSQVAAHEEEGADHGRQAQGDDPRNRRRAGAGGPCRRWRQRVIGAGMAGSGRVVGIRCRGCGISGGIGHSGRQCSTGFVRTRLRRALRFAYRRACLPHAAATGWRAR